jgi:hypothetical protein
VHSCLLSSFPVWTGSVAQNRAGGAARPAFDPGRSFVSWVNVDSSLNLSELVASQRYSTFRTLFLIS